MADLASIKKEGNPVDGLSKQIYIFFTLFLVIYLIVTGSIGLTDDPEKEDFNKSVETIFYSCLAFSLLFLLVLWWWWYKKGGLYWVYFGDRGGNFIENEQITGNQKYIINISIICLVIFGIICLYEAGEISDLNVDESFNDTLNYAVGSVFLISGIGFFIYYNKLIFYKKKEKPEPGPDPPSLPEEQIDESDRRIKELEKRIKNLGEKTTVSVDAILNSYKQIKKDITDSKQAKNNSKQVKDVEIARLGYLEKDIDKIEKETKEVQEKLIESQKKMSQKLFSPYENENQK